MPSRAFLLPLSGLIGKRFTIHFLLPKSSFPFGWHSLPILIPCVSSSSSQEPDSSHTLVHATRAPVSSITREKARLPFWKLYWGGSYSWTHLESPGLQLGACLQVKVNLQGRQEMENEGPHPGHLAQRKGLVSLQGTWQPPRGLASLLLGKEVSQFISALDGSWSRQGKLYLRQALLKIEMSWHSSMLGKKPNQRQPISMLEDTLQVKADTSAF